MKLVYWLIDILPTIYAAIFIFASWSWLVYELNILEISGGQVLEIVVAVIMILGLPIAIILFLLTVEYPLLCIANLFAALVLRLINNRR